MAIPTTTDRTRKFVLSIYNMAVKPTKVIEVQSPPMIEPKPGERNFYIIIPAIGDPDTIELH